MEPEGAATGATDATGGGNRDRGSWLVKSMINTDHLERATAGHGQHLHHPLANVNTENQIAKWIVQISFISIFYILESCELKVNEQSGYKM